MKIPQYIRTKGRKAALQSVVGQRPQSGPPKQSVRKQYKQFPNVQEVWEQRNEHQFIVQTNE